MVSARFATAFAFSFFILFISFIISTMVFTIESGTIKETVRTLTENSYQNQTFLSISFEMCYKSIADSFNSFPVFGQASVKIAKENKVGDWATKLGSILVFKNCCYTAPRMPSCGHSHTGTSTAAKSPTPAAQQASMASDGVQKTPK